MAIDEGAINVETKYRVHRGRSSEDNPFNNTLLPFGFPTRASNLASAHTRDSLARPPLTALRETHLLISAGHFLDVWGLFLIVSRMSPQRSPRPGAGDPVEGRPALISLRQGHILAREEIRLGFAQAFF